MHIILVYFLFLAMHMVKMEGKMALHPRPLAPHQTICSNPDYLRHPRRLAPRKNACFTPDHFSTPRPLAPPNTACSTTAHVLHPRSLAPPQRTCSTKPTMRVRDRWIATEVMFTRDNFQHQIFGLVDTLLAWLRVSMHQEECAMNLRYTLS